MLVANATISPASSSGCSRAAKCPPLGMSVHLLISVKTRSTHSRGGMSVSAGKWATAVGTRIACPGAKLTGLRRASQ